jgi:hypothetical protein
MNDRGGAMVLAFPGGPVALIHRVRYTLKLVPFAGIDVLRIFRIVQKC